jgi:SAM-dependent methyltransferase
VNPVPRDDVLDSLYNASFYTFTRRYIEMEKARRGDDYVSTSLPRDAALEIIDRAVKIVEHGRWLDVGGGTGSFLHLVQARYPLRFEAALLDHNAASAEFARTHYGLPTLDALPDGHGARYDVVSLIAILEHVPRPFELLSALDRILSPGGVIAISVPRLPRLAWLYRQEYPFFLPPYHLSMFDVGAIRTMLRRIGYEIFDVWETGDPALWFTYLFPLSSRSDLRIPQRAGDRLESFHDPALTVVERAIGWACAKVDALTESVRVAIDGRVMLNLICRRAAAV